MKRCINCGKENPDTAKFCGYCGKGLPETPVQVPPPPPDFNAGRAPRRTPPPQAEPPAYNRPQTTPPAQVPPRMRPPAYPPPGRQAQPRMAATPQSSQQRLIVIGAAAVVLILVLVCAVIVIINREMIQEAVTGLIDPAARQTQIANDIQIGLTQTASVNIDIPATVQAQIALTQAAAGQQPAPLQNEAPPAAAEQPTPGTQGQSAAPEEADYIQKMTQKMQVYVETMAKVDQLLTQAQADANKLADTQWQADLTAASALINQNGTAVRQLTAPQKYADVQPEAVKAADSLDNAMKLITEYLTNKNADTLKNAVDAKTQGMASVMAVQNKITALPPG
jgi:hypothetical protein